MSPDQRYIKPPITVQYNCDLEVIHANQAALDFVGKPLDQIKGMRCIEFWGHKQLKYCKNCPLKSLNGEFTYNSSLVQLQDGGNWWNANISTVFDDKGIKTGLLVQYYEIDSFSTSRKPIHQLLERQYLAHPHPQVIAEYHTGNIILANTAAEELLGVSLDELSQLSIFDENLFQQDITNQIMEELSMFGVSEGHHFNFPGVNKNQEFTISAQRIIVSNVPLIAIRLHDITENQHLKGLLERLEQRFHSTLASSRINVWEFDIIGDKFHIYYPIYRKPDEAVTTVNTETIDTLHLETVHPEDVEHLYKHITSLRKDATDIRVTYRVYDPDTNKFEYHQLTGNVVSRDENGNNAVAQGTIMNVSELERLKEERSLGGMLYSHLFGKSPIMILVTKDSDGSIVDANAAFLEFSGYTKNEILGLHPMDIGIWYENKEEWKRFAEIFDKRRLLKDIQVPFRDKNGEVHQVLLTIDFVMWEGEPCALAIGLDNTEEYRLREALLKSQEHLENALDAIQEGFFDWNVVTREIFTNKNFHRILGYEPGEFPINFDNWISIIYPEDLPSLNEQWQKTLSGEIDLDTFRFRMLTKERKPKWVLHRHKVIEHDEEQRPVRIVGTVTDLTEQLKVEQELAKQNATFAGVLKAIDEGIWEYDTKQRLILLNDRCQELIGLVDTPSIKGDDVQEQIFSLFHPDDLAALQFEYKQHLRGHIPFFHKEGRFTSPTGENRWYNIRGAILERSETGKPTRIVGTVADITERKTLTAEMEIARAGIEQTSMMAFLIQTDASFLYVNQEACDELGYTAKEFEQLRILDIVPDFVIPKLPPRKIAEMDIDEINQEYFPDMELEFVRKDGTSFPVRVNPRAVKLQNTVFYWAFAIDISNVKAMETELREERESLAIRVEERTRELAATNEFTELLLQAIPIPIYFKDENYQYIDANQAFADYFGFARKELIGKTVFDIIPEDFADAIMKDDSVIMQSGEQMIKQSKLTDNTGAVRDVVLMKTGFINPRNGKHGIVGTFLDITESMLLQEQLEESNRELNRAIHIKDEFLANMSHELRTPLTSIIGYSQLMIAGMGGELQPNHEKYVNHIHTAGQHLLGLINDILDYSKFNAEVETLHFEYSRVRTICISTLSIMEPRAYKKEIEMKFDFDDSIDTLYCDPRRISQVLINLMNNAIKFSEPNGTVGLSVKKVSPENPAIEFKIWDNGIGIDQKDLERIFEPFTQAVGTLQRNYEGSGIGLALSKKFVELHNGTIRVVSEPGTGSIFYVRIPIVEDGDVEKV